MPEPTADVSHETSRAIVAAIRAARFRYSNEDDLQRGIAAVLADAGIPAEREAWLSGQSRVDLLAGRVGVEVKIASTRTVVTRQLLRYARSGKLDEIILVTNSSRHRFIASALAGVPVTVVCISAL